MIKSITKYIGDKLPEEFIYSGENLDFKRPIIENNEDKGTLTRIYNSCKNCLIKKDLSIYISEEGLSILLRCNAQVHLKNIISNIEDDEFHIIKKTTIDGKIIDVRYISIGELLRLINKEIEISKDYKKRIYLRKSEEALRNLRDCDKLELKRIEKESNYDKELKKLKKKRIKKYKLKKDELTGDTLRKDAEFSHIRSKASYPNLALDINNGLVVNKKTHDEITRMNIEDEDSLLKLCNKNEWSTEWYKKYINIYK